MIEYHPPLAKDNATTIEKAIQKVRFDDVENLYVFKNGKQIRRFRGTVNRVTPPKQYFFEMKDSTLIHNHPSGSSFSLEDIQSAVVHDVKLFILVTKNSKFELLRPVSGWNFDPSSDSMNSLLNACKEIADESLHKEILKNEMSIDEKELLTMHYIWSLFFDYYGISYKKITL